MVRFRVWIWGGYPNNHNRTRNRKIYPTVTHTRKIPEILYPKPNHSDQLLAGIGFDGFVTSRPGADHFPGPLHYRSTILSALGPDYALTVLFLGTHTRTSRWVTHPGIALARYSLNFGVPTEPEASELPKGLALGRDGNIHIRITPLGDVGSHRLNCHP